MFIIHLCRYKTLNETTSSCLGGDNLLGLKIMENDANVAVGDIIVGRESGSFLGKVSNKKSFLEAMQFYKNKPGFKDTADQTP